MNTQTHVLLASALLSKNGKSNRYRNLIILFGALTPDILILVMAGVASLQNVSADILWGEWYFSSPWQDWIDASNSIPIYMGMLLVTALFIKHKKYRLYLTLFCVAALLHILFDLPVHVDDGHAHFWPFSQWRFESTVSYWDPQHHGIATSLIEALAGVILIVILWKRFKTKPDKMVVRVILSLLASLYILVPLVYLAML